MGCTCEWKRLGFDASLDRTRAHFAPACVPGGPIPDGFWVVWEGPPYHPHSLGDGSKCRRGKGLKTICLGQTRTSDTYKCKLFDDMLSESDDMLSVESNDMLCGI